MGNQWSYCWKVGLTFASLGTPAFKLHPAEAMHGDLGVVSEKDVVIATSFSGESDEIVKILPNIKMIGAYISGDYWKSKLLTCTDIRCCSNTT